MILEGKTLKMETLDVVFAPLYGIDTGYTIDGLKYPVLRTLNFRNTGIKTVFCLDHPTLLDVDLWFNALMISVGALNCPVMEYFVARSGATSYVLFENLPTLDLLDIRNNELTTVDIRQVNPTNPFRLSVALNQNLTTLITDADDRVKSLYADKTNLASIDVSTLGVRSILFANNNPSLHSLIPSATALHKKITLYDTPMTSSELDDFFTALFPTSVTAEIFLDKANHNPVAGLSGCDITIATNKGYTVYT